MEEDPLKNIGLEKIDAHASQEGLLGGNPLLVAGKPGKTFRRRLLVETGDPPCGAYLHYAKPGSFLCGNGLGGYADVRSGGNELPNEPGEIHPVELISRKDQHHVRAEGEYVDQPLPHGVGGALEPVGVLRGLFRGEDGDEAVAEPVEPVGLAHVAVQAFAVVLGEHQYLPYAIVHAVGNRNVYEPVLSPDGNRGLAPVKRKRKQPGAPAAAENNGNYSHPALLVAPCTLPFIK